jgi:c(7)-type cytochrome triheme protein
MMRKLVILLILVGALAFVSSALAVPPGKSIEFQGGELGKVVLDGKIHFDKGLKCTDCHTQIFQMKKGTVKITMADINAGKFCGVCHNGDRSFKASDPKNCAKCHKK